MKDCIYCRAQLTATTKRAHVWSAGLGGRLKSHEICCDDCNTVTGRLEDNLRESLVRVYAAVGATKDDRKAFKIQVEFGGHTFVFSEGNAIRQVARTRFDRETKKIVVPLPAGFDEQVRVTAKAFWDQYWKPEDVDKLVFEPGDPGPELPIGPIRTEYDLKVGGTNEHKRVFAKMALELLAYHRHDLAMSGELSEARRFVRHGSGTLASKVDTRSIGSGLLENVVRPEIWNAIEVWSFRRTVYFRVVFLGPLAFTGTLTTNWTGEPFRAAYAFDARNPANLLASCIESSDGPNVAVWFDGMKEETAESSIAEIEAISQRVARSAPKLQPERVWSPS